MAIVEYYQITLSRVEEMLVGTRTWQTSGVGSGESEVTVVVRKLGTLPSNRPRNAEASTD